MSWQDQREMTGAQFEEAILKLGMSRAGAGRFLGLSERQTRRLVRGQKPVPESAALLLASMLAHGETPVVPRWSRWSY